MNKSFTIAILLSITLSFSKEYPVKNSLNANVYNDFISNFVEQGMRLNFDTDKSSLLWYVDYMMFPVAILFTDTLRHALAEHIEKYKDWNKKATEKGVKVDKEIGELPATTVWFKYGDDWEKDSNAKIHVKFFSQNSQKHQLIVYFEELESDYNEYTTHSPETLYLWWADVIAFENAISDTSAQQYLLGVSKKQSIEEDFQ